MIWTHLTKYLFIMNLKKTWSEGTETNINCAYIRISLKTKILNIRKNIFVKIPVFL